MSQQVTHQVTHQVDYSSFATQEQLEALGSKVNSISEKLGELLSKLPDGSLGETKELNEPTIADQLVPLNIEASSIEEPLPELSKSISLDGEPISELSSNSLIENLDSHERDVRFLATHLGKRLGIGGSTISVRKNDPPEKFAEWSRSKDPDNIAWSFLSESNRFQPIGDLSSDLQSKLLSELPSEPPNTLTNGELAKRLGMDNSTLSHWKGSDPKRGKSPDELLRLTRDKDPDGIGWVLVPEINRFKPEKELPGSSTSVLQGELLNVEQV